MMIISVTKPLKKSFAIGLGSLLLSLSVNVFAVDENSNSLVVKSPQQRAAEMVKQMTLEEKASQLVNQSRAIQRLNIPAYDWWSEALHGVQTKDVTVFPEPVGLAATFDQDAIKKMANIIGVEGRIKHAQFMREGHSNVFEGLDFWAPNINIFRDPRWGRGQETYGEDPYLSGRLGTAYVKGMQGDDPNYYLAIATPKHFAVHSGPESTRHKADVPVSKHDMLDTYLPAFRAAITEGKAASVMCAYNSVNGQPACANEFLLQDQLRDKWKFEGYVVSDCEAVVNIFRDHKFTTTQAEASALSLKRGMDNECIDFALRNDIDDYKPYLDAVKQGFLKESEIDIALVRLYTARIKLGMFDAPEKVPYNAIDEKRLDSAEHRAMALSLANKSMVLLKNDGTLPLKQPKKIAVVGPLADQTQYLLGNYNGSPTYSISVLDAIKKEFPNAQVEFSAGTQFLRKEGSAVPASIFSEEKKSNSLQLNFYSDFWPNDKAKPIVQQSSSSVELSDKNLPEQLKATYPLRTEWSGFISVPESSEYSFGIKFKAGYGRVDIDGKPLAQGWAGDGAEPAKKAGHIYLQAGKKYPVKISYVQGKAGPRMAEMFWSKYDPTPSADLKNLVASSDVVIAVVGITSELEGEEMPVSEEGFSGGDRTSIDLPKPEQSLLENVVSFGKPTVVVLANGSALAVNWANKNANAILESWYAGQEGGTAVAQTLSGKNNPAGRLPVTFYQSVDQIPAFDNYAMKGRTYRYFSGEPLYPFGFGLSYTKFAYQNLKVSKKSINAGDNLDVTVQLKNIGAVDGDEVAQLYVTAPAAEGNPLRALKGFTRVHLKAGETQTLHFSLNERDMSVVNSSGDIQVLSGRYSIAVGGGQPQTNAPKMQGQFDVKGTKQLAE